MTTFIRGSDNFDTNVFRLLDSSSDISSGGDSKGKQIDITFSSGAKFITFDFLVQPSNDSVSYSVLLGNGSIDTGANYTWAQDYVNHAASPTYGDSGATGASLISLAGTMGNATDEGFSGRVTVQVASAWTYVTWECMGVNASAVAYTLRGSGYYNTTSDRMRFQHGGATDSWAEGWYLCREWVP